MRSCSWREACWNGSRFPGVLPHRMNETSGIVPWVGLAVLVVFCALSSACAREPQAPAGQQAEKQDGQERSKIVVSEPSKMAVGEATTAEGDIGILAGGTPPPEYEVQKNGTLVIGGDVLVSCRDLGSWAGPPSASRSVKQQIDREQREQIKACAKAGFPPDETPR